VRSDFSRELPRKPLASHDTSIGGYVQGVDVMAAWGITCLNCNRQFVQFNIEDDLENLYLPVKPDLPKGGKELACPHCGRKATYQRTDLFYMR
jgi:DNA-directed RNA polymerase subunit RPC12/RpoP